LSPTLLKNFSREDIARLFGYVQQKSLIVSGTILDNITYGNRSGFNFAEVVAAAKKAKIHDEIERDLGGYAGEVQEGGKNLSGGQVQRIALSRLFLYKSPILVLDEATSALDKITEKEVQENLEEYMRNCTVIQIAHLLSTLRNCDQIIVFEQNKIIESGTYSQLFDQKGLFYKLHKSIKA
jgi:ATP-binding cassette subfamily B protein